MELRELLAGADVIEIAGDGGAEIEGLAYDSRRVGPGIAVLLRTRERPPTATTSRRRGRGGSGGARRRAPARPRPAVRRSSSPTRGRRWRRAAGRFYGDPTAELRVVGVTGTNGKTTTAFLVRHILESAGVQDGPAGDGEADRRRTGRGGRAHDAGGDRPAGDVPRACSRRRPGLRDGGLLARARAAPRRRRSASTVAAFTNLTQDHLDFHAGHGGLLRRQAPPVRAGGRRRERRGGQRRRPLRATASRPSLRAALTVSAAGDPRADYRAGEVGFDAAGSRFRCLRTGRPRRSSRCRCPGRFNVENALGAIASAAALGLPLADAAEALAGAERVPGRFEPVDEGQPFARPRRLRAHPRLARERARRGASDHRAGG